MFNDHEDDDAPIEPSFIKKVAIGFILSLFFFLFFNVDTLTPKDIAYYCMYSIFISILFNLITLRL